MTNIKVSVILSLFNEEKYIKNCIESLVAQTFCRDQMEWILVDGGSTDRTLEILKDYQASEKYPIGIKEYSL